MVPIHGSITTIRPIPTPPTINTSKEGVGGLSAIPSTARNGSRGVGHSEGKRLTHGTTPSTGDCGVGYFRRHLPCLCSRAARGSGSGSGISPTLTITHRVCRESLIPLVTTPPICMRGNREYGPTSHMGRVCPVEGEHRGSRHPESGNSEGTLVLLEVFLEEGALQRLPATVGVLE